MGFDCYKISIIYSFECYIVIIEIGVLKNFVLIEILISPRKRSISTSMEIYEEIPLMTF